MADDTTAAAHDLVLSRDLRAVRFLTLNRPEKANALNSALLDALERELEKALNDEKIRVVVLSGAGRGFSSGVDLNENNRATGSDYRREPIDEYRRITDSIRRWFRIWDYPKPTIAQVHGYCIGMATQLAAVCDITLVAEDAAISWPKLRAGGGVLSPMWVHLVGPKRAKEMSFVSGSTIDGTTAAAWGWANRAVPAEDLAKEVTELAIRISYTAPGILELKKAAINRMVEAQGFRMQMMTVGLNDAVLHSSAEGAVRFQTLSEHGVREANAQWEREADEMVATVLAEESL